MENNRFPREISLCLSGGAAKGAYHLGAISVLEENGVEVKAISGTSIGALIGASLACGKSATEIFEVMKSKEFRKVFKFKLGKPYLFELNKDADVVSKIIDKNSFQELEIPLIVAVSDMDEEVAYYFDEGEEFKDIVLASCSIAPLFKTVQIKNHLFGDGGVIDNFPVQELLKYKYPIVGINLYPKYNKQAKSIFGWIKKTFYIAWQSHNREKEKLCDIFISSDALNTISTFSFKDIDMAYKLGREEMLKHISSSSYIESK